jgi:peptidoglycan/xylan/chitin deacetylase (PgdA/CDA1 family)
MEAGAPIPQGLANIERSRARRAERARSQRRRRRAAGGGVLVIVAAAIGLVVALSGAGGTAAQKKVKVPVAAGRRPCLGARRPQAAAILEYHVIAAAPAGVPYPLLYVTPAQFSAQMHAIADAGYRAVTLDQLWNNWHHEAPLPCGKPIVVSFDNGYYSQYDAALPVLRSLGWVGVENLQLTGLPPSQGGLSRREIRLLVKGGWELDTQGYDHVDLVGLSPSQLRFQTATTRRTIQRRYDVPVNWFCYPSGTYDPTVIAALRTAGFRGSTTEVHGWASVKDDPFALPRLEVQPTLSPAALVQSVAEMRDDPPPGDSGAH